VGQHQLAQNRKEVIPIRFLLVLRNEGRENSDPQINQDRFWEQWWRESDFRPMELFSDCECFEATARWAFMVKSKCYIVAFRNQEEFFKNHQTKDFNSSKSVKSKWLVGHQRVVEGW